MISSRLRVFVCAFSTVWPFMLADAAGAATVQCGAGDAQCLVSAINEANSRPQLKTTIRLAGGTYALSAVDNLIGGPNGLPSIVSTITIKADKAGTTLTRAAGSLPFRFLHIESTGCLTLNGLSLVDGSATTPGGSLGGAILNDGGTVTIVGVLFNSNQASSGGAIFTNLGELTIADSTFLMNRATDAGAIHNKGGIVRVRRSQFSHNDGNFTAGAVWSEDGELHISQSRFFGGRFTTGAGAVGGASSRSAGGDEEPICRQ